MREIKFRGKRKDNGDWVYGSLIDKDYILQYIDKAESWTAGTGDHKITCRAFEVIPETVGQYIGINDKNNQQIFEDDILKGKFGTGGGGRSTKHKEFYYSVRYSNHCPEFFIDMPKNYGNYRFCPHLNQSEIAGNVHDNAELLSQTAAT